MHQIIKKLVLVLVTSVLITEVSKENIVVLDRVPCIRYLIHFKNEVWALIKSGNKVNAMTPRYASKLGLKICLTNVRAQKIDDSIFEMFEIVLASFQIEDKLKKA